MQTNSTEMNKGSQNATYVEVGEHEGFKVKIAIRTDTYKFQGSARAFVWSKAELKWNEVCSIIPERMATNKDLVYIDRPIKSTDFAIDRNTLLDEMAYILGQ